jgi:hypothetical protein
VIWADDAQIVWLLRSKSLTDEKIGCTEIFVRELENTIPDYEQIITDIKENIYLGDYGTTDERTEAIDLREPAESSGRGH